MTVRVMPRVLNKKTDEIPPDAIYIGRPSKWGNPFVLGRHGDREYCVERYRRMIEDALDRNGGLLEELRGKDLVCFCAPLSCHGDVLLELANR
jgi:hypothetical protein